MKNKQPKQSKMTLNKLTVTLDKRFNEVEKKFKNVDQRFDKLGKEVNRQINILDERIIELDKKVDTTFGDLKGQYQEIMAGQAEILGKLEKWDEENLAGAEANRRFEDRIFTLEEDMKIIKAKIRI